MLGLRSHIFFVEALTEARDWYARVLEQGPYFDTPFYVGFDVGGYELGLHPAEGDKVPGVGGDRAYWGVENAQAAFARLVELGASALEPVQEVGGGIKVGAVRDPFGNALGIIENPAFKKDVVEIVGPGHRLGAAPDDLSDRAIVHSRTVAASPAELWPLWTTTEGVQRWFVDHAQVELRIGGPFELYFLMDRPPGGRGSDGCRILSWIPQRMLSFTWNAPPHLAQTRPQYTWVVVELEVEGNGTRVRLSHLGWPASGLADPDSEWSETFEYFDRAWVQVLGSLAALFEPAEPA